MLSGELWKKGGPAPQRRAGPRCSNTNYYQRLLALARTVTSGGEGIKFITKVLWLIYVYKMLFLGVVTVLKQVHCYKSLEVMEEITGHHECETK